MRMRIHFDGGSFGTWLVGYVVAAGVSGSKGWDLTWLLLATVPAAALSELLFGRYMRALQGQDDSPLGRRRRRVGWIVLIVLLIAVFAVGFATTPG